MNNVDEKAKVAAVFVYLLLNYLIWAVITYIICESFSVEYNWLTPIGGMLVYKLVKIGVRK